MQQLWFLSLLAVLMTGCAHHRTLARLDVYESVQVDDLTGNKVSRGVFDRRTLWLNARREVRRDQSRDYYLITELTPSPDFTLQNPGESLVLLVDGTRYAFAATNTVAPLKPRAGIQTTVYRVPGEVLVKVANAQELRIRLKGTTTVLDELAPPSVTERLKQWMLERFTPEAASATPRSEASPEPDRAQRTTLPAQP